MEKGSIKTIKYSVALDQKLVKLAQSLGISKRLLFERMIDYFYRTKKDPIDLNDELLKQSIHKSHKAYTSFIKTQENLLLIPMKESMDKMIANQKDIVRYFNEQVLGSNRQLLKNQQELKQLLLEQFKKETAKLKGGFLQLFDQYIQAREELGAFKGKEREALAEHIRQQIKNL